MRIVKEGKTKDGVDCCIRYPESTDVHSAWEYINRLSKERTFIRFQGEEVSIEEEERFLVDQMKRIEEHRAVLLFIIVDGQIQGTSGIELEPKTENHVGVLGLSLDASLRGQGLGEFFMRTVINEGIKEMSGMRIITLKVKAPNVVAISLYQKLGFEIYSRLPLGTQHRGEFVDELAMYMNVER